MFRPFRVGAGYRESGPCVVARGGSDSAPPYARAAGDNAGSLRVLEKTGFRIIGTEVSFAPACGAEIEETILWFGFGDKSCQNCRPAEQQLHN